MCALFLTPLFSLSSPALERNADLVLLLCPKGPEQRRYVGPSGSPEQGFLTYSVDDKDGETRFSDYWRHHRDTRTGHRRLRCKTVSGD